MLKFRYTTDSGHVLDVCGHCEDVWLQANEWEFLKARSLHGELPKIFTQPWQKDLRAERARQAFEEGWDRRMGKDLHDKAREIHAWLRHHPNRSAFLDYLSSKDPYGT